MLAGGGALILTASPNLAAAAGSSAHLPSLPGLHANNNVGGSGSGASTATAPGHTSPPCTNQHNLTFPGTTPALDSYTFTITHAGVTTTVCSLFGAVHAGDTVTANLTLHSGAAVEVTLLANTANPGHAAAQQLSQCASFSSVADATGGDPCSTAASPSLTVVVPACGFQVDLIYGEALPAINAGHYAAAGQWINGMAGDRGTGCPGGPTPTPTPAPVTSPTPSSGVQAASTETSTPETGFGDDIQRLALGAMLIVLGIAALGAASNDGRGKRRGGRDSG